MAKNSVVTMTAQLTGGSENVRVMVRKERFCFLIIPLKQILIHIFSYFHILFFVLESGGDEESFSGNCLKDYTRKK